MHEKEIDGRRDAATAIADDLPVFRHTARFEFLRRIRKSREALCRRVDEGRRRYVDAARHASGTAVSARLQAAMELRAERVHDDGAWIADGGHCLVLVDEQSRSRPRLERGGRIAFRFAALGRAAF